MLDEREFARLADSFMEELFTVLTEMDPDEVDADLAMGVLSIEFADGKRCILNRQVPARQLWLAHGATAWHFDLNEGQWVDTKGRGELRAVLAQELSEKLGHPVRV